MPKVLCLRIRVKMGSNQYPMNACACACVCVGIVRAGRGVQRALQKKDTPWSARSHLCLPGWETGYSSHLKPISEIDKHLGNFLKTQILSPTLDSSSSHLRKNQNTILQNSQPGMTVRVWGPVICPAPALTAEETKGGRCSSHMVFEPEISGARPVVTGLGHHSPLSCLPSHNPPPLGQSVLEDLGSSD